MIAVQDSLNEQMINLPESSLKRFYAQALGNSSFTVGQGGASQTRIEIPPCVERVDKRELGYVFQWNNGVKITIATDATFPANRNGIIKIPVLPVSYLSEFLKIEDYFSSSTDKLIDFTNFTKYSKESSSLFNNFQKRHLSQRFNFAKDIQASTLLLTGDLAPNAAKSFDIDGYLDNDISTVDLIDQSPVQFYQEKFIPLVDISYVSTGNGKKGNFTITPRKFIFNYRLGDAVHDSYYNRYKELPHSDSIVMILYWNTIQEMIQQIQYTFTVTDEAISLFSMVKSSGLLPYDRMETLTISNIFVKYYSETNQRLIQNLMNSELNMVYPVVYQTNVNTQGNAQNGVTLLLGNEGENRLYRIYTSLFQGGPTNVIRYMSNNNCNTPTLINAILQNEKWDQNVEFYINNDLYSKIIVGTSASGYISDWKEMYERFVDGSLNSGKEIDYHGTLVWDFDTSKYVATKYEYADNAMKGLLMDHQMVINPRFLNTHIVDGNQSYNQYLFAVVLKKCTIKNGLMTRI